MRDLALVSNRGPFAFSQRFIHEAEESLRTNTPPVPPTFGEGGLVQAMAGLLRGDRWRPIWIGASLGDKDIDVAYGHHNELFEKMHEHGYAPEYFPEIVIEPNKRIRFRYRDYDFYMRIVFFDTEHMHSYYTTFSNGFLWPLMHLTHSPLLYKTKEKVFPRPIFRKNDYLQYTSSNVTFAHTVFDETMKSRALWGKGDQFIVWNQDYHLMQVAERYKALVAAEGMAREESKRIRVGQFMHTPFFNVHEIQGLLREDKRRRMRGERFDPFPESIETVLQKLVWGMLANDFVGFHHKEYCDNYLEALQEWFPRYHVTIRQRAQFYEVSHPNGVTTLGVFPIGLDVGKILEATREDQRLVHRYGDQDLQEMMQNDKERGRYIFGGLERCDYTKGLVARLGIFANVLMRLRQEKREKFDARLYQVTAPSRSDNPEYRKLEGVIREQVRLKNEELSTDLEPIVRLDRGIPPPENYRFMREVDVMLVTPLEDGMNLVAFEYVLSQKYRSNRGLLVLGKCGAARVLRSAGFKEEDGVVYVDPLKEENAGGRVAEWLRRGVGISDRLIDYIEQEFRVDDWAQKNIEAIVGCRKLQ
jgi:trehalose-6-phosphate synthase